MAALWKTATPKFEERQSLPVVNMMTSSKPPEPTLSLLERALKESLHSPTFLDVKFFAFSRRSYGPDDVVRVDKPQHVLAMSSVLKKVDYFDKLLSNGFAESNDRTSLDAGFPGDKDPYTDEYDYESDSDLEEDGESVDEETDATPPQRRSGKGREMSAPSGPGAQRKGQCQLIIIKDAAYYTWRAFIFYLYFGKVHFLPLRSQDDQKRAEELVQALGDPEAIPPSSPKSMYRLAEKYGITELQNLAFEAIRAQLTAKNIVREVFSRFTSRYDKVRELVIDVLQSHKSHPEVATALNTFIVERFALGEFPHAGPIVNILIQRNMGNNDDSRAVVPESRDVVPVSDLGRGVSSTSRGLRPAPLKFGGEGLHAMRRGQPIRGNFAPPPFRSSYPSSFPPPQPAPSGSAWTTFSPPPFDDDF